jgi:hypothetical protein
MSPGLYAIEVAAPDSYLIDILEEAVGMLEQGADALRAVLSSRLALALYYTEQQGRRRALVAETAGSLHQLGPADRAYVSVTNNAALWEPGDLDQREQRSAEALARTRAAGTKELEYVALLYSATVALERGDRDAFDARSEDFKQVTTDLKQVHDASTLLAVDSSLAFCDGKLGESYGLAQRALALAVRFQLRNAIQGAAVQLAFSSLELDRAADFAEIARQAVTQNPGVPTWQIAYAFALVAHDDLSGAKAVFEALSPTGFTVPRDVTWMTSRALLTEVAVALGELDVARSLSEQLAPLHDHCICAGWGCGFQGSAKRYLGLLSTALGDWSEASAHLEGAIEVSRRFRAPLALGYAQHDLAVLLRTRTDAPDPARARKLDEEVLAAAGEHRWPRLERIVRESLSA